MTAISFSQGAMFEVAHKYILKLKEKGTLEYLLEEAEVDREVCF